MYVAEFMFINSFFLSLEINIISVSLMIYILSDRDIWRVLFTWFLLDGEMHDVLPACLRQFNQFRLDKTKIIGITC